MSPSVAVVVPVLNRPERAALFVPSCRMSVGWDIPIHAICENRTDWQAWSAAGAIAWSKLFARQPHTFPEKCNDAAEWLGAEWLFFVGDDVRFECGWLDEALRVAAETGALVVGTNDMHNPWVIAGERGTHNLINRRYIVERGACLDGPGTVYSEAYHHECDVETVEVAKARGVWASAHNSRVEHLHPTWGTGVDDATYREGRRWRMKDHQTWMARQATMGARLAELDGPR